jgi:hypothetical protein
MLRIVAGWCVAALAFGAAWGVRDEAARVGPQSRRRGGAMSDAFMVVLAILGLLVLGAAVLEFVLFLAAAAHR